MAPSLLVRDLVGGIRAQRFCRASEKREEVATIRGRTALFAMCICTYGTILLHCVSPFLWSPLMQAVPPREDVFIGVLEDTYTDALDESENLKVHNDHRWYWSTSLPLRIHLLIRICSVMQNCL